MHTYCTIAIEYVMCCVYWQETKVNLKQLIVRELAYFWKSICMLEHIGILSFRILLALSALLHLVHLHYYAWFICFIYTKIYVFNLSWFSSLLFNLLTANSSASFAAFALPEEVPNTHQHGQEYKWVCQQKDKQNCGCYVEVNGKNLPTQQRYQHQIDQVECFNVVMFWFTVRLN